MARQRMYLNRRLRACVAALAVAIVGLLACAGSALAVPANFWGVVPQAPPTAEEFQRLKTGGVDSFRLAISWATVQPQRGGAIDWSVPDAEAEGAVKAGLEVLPFVFGAPTWAVPSAPVPGSRGLVHAPVKLPASGAAKAAWATLLKAAVAHYGPGGEFWVTHPALPVRPLRTWQIWNEQNFKYFVTKPNPVEYGTLLKNSYAALKAADPGAKVILGGMFARPREALFKKKPAQAYFAADFLQRMYKAHPGIKSKFDGVGLHPYSTTYANLTPAIEELRDVLKANHDAGTGIWITELGWSSQAPTRNNQFAKGLAGQATQLRKAFALLSAKQAKWHIQRVFWFSVDDRTASCNFCDGSGLFGSGFAPKPAWFAYVKFSGGTP